MARPNSRAAPAPELPTLDAAPPAAALTEAEPAAATPALEAATAPVTAADAPAEVAVPGREPDALVAEAEAAPTQTDIAREASPTPPRPRYGGWIRVDADHVIRGWFTDREDRDAHADVEVLIDDVVVGVVRADRLDPKLVTIDEGDGRYAFALTPPEAYRDGQPHTFAARAPAYDFKLKSKLNTFVVPREIRIPRVEIVLAGPGLVYGRLLDERPGVREALELWLDGRRLEDLPALQWLPERGPGDFLLELPRAFAPDGGTLRIAAPGTVEAGILGGEIVLSPVVAAESSEHGSPQELVRRLSADDVRLAYELFLDETAVSRETAAKRSTMELGRFLSFLVQQRRFAANVLQRLSGAGPGAGQPFRVVDPETISRLAEMTGLPDLPALFEFGEVPRDAFFRQLLIWPDFLDLLTPAARAAVQLTLPRLPDFPEQGDRRLMGGLDPVVDGRISGWMFSLHDPKERLVLEVLADGRLIGAAGCEQARADLSGSLLDDRGIGFALQLPDRVSLPSPFRLSLRDAVDKRTVLQRLVAAPVGSPDACGHPQLEDHRDAEVRDEEPEPWTGRRLRFSIIIAGGEGREGDVRASAASVALQSYRDWDLLAVQPSGASDLAVLTVGPAGSMEGSEGVCQQIDEAVERATGDYVGWLTPGDVLAPDALEAFARALQQKRATLVYADCETGAGPVLNPGLDRELLLQEDYLGFFVLRTEVARAMGGLHPEFEGAHTHDFLLRTLQGLSDSEVLHVPHVAVRREGHRPSAQMERTVVEGRRARAIQRHLDHVGGVEASVRPATPGTPVRIHWGAGQPPPSFSLILCPGRNHALFGPCLRALLVSTAFAPGVEVLAVQPDGAPAEVLAALQASADHGALQLIRGDKAASRATLRNLAAEAASGDVLVFVDTDLAPAAHGWLLELASQASRPEVGAVGARLIGPDGAIWHAGVLGVGGNPVNDGQGRPLDEPGYLARRHRVHEAIAVRGDTLAVRAGLFRALGGFDAEEFGDGCEDLDFCLRVGDAGYRVIYTPYAVLHRLRDETDPDRKARKALRSRWPAAFRNDRFYNPAFDRAAPPFTVIASAGADKSEPAAPEPVLVG